MSSLLHIETAQYLLIAYSVLFLPPASPATVHFGSVQPTLQRTTHLEQARFRDRLPSLLQPWSLPASVSDPHPIENRSAYQASNNLSSAHHHPAPYSYLVRCESFGPTLSTTKLCDGSSTSKWTMLSHWPCKPYPLQLNITTRSGTPSITDTKRRAAESLKKIHTSMKCALLKRMAWCFGVVAMLPRTKKLLRWSDTEARFFLDDPVNHDGEPAR